MSIAKMRPSSFVSELAHGLQLSVKHSECQEHLFIIYLLMCFFTCADYLKPGGGGGGVFDIGFRFQAQGWVRPPPHSHEGTNIIPSIL